MSMLKTSKSGKDTPVSVSFPRSDFIEMTVLSEMFFFFFPPPPVSAYSATFWSVWLKSRDFKSVLCLRVLRTAKSPVVLATEKLWDILSRSLVNTGFRCYWEQYEAAYRGISLAFQG